MYTRCFRGSQHICLRHKSNLRLYDRKFSSGVSEPSELWFRASCNIHHLPTPSARTCCCCCSVSEEVIGDYPGVARSTWYALWRVTTIICNIHGLGQTFSSWMSPLNSSTSLCIEENEQCALWSPTDGEGWGVMDPYFQTALCLFYFIKTC